MNKRTSTGPSTLDSFVECLLDDIALRKARSLATYQRMFPEIASDIAETYQELCSESGARRPVPDRIGSYKILDSLGEGGMGSVYLAEQTEHLKRKVAVKIIRFGRDTDEIIRRFESERQTLAMMDHPNIARVYEAGRTEDGLPYFVMEYVPGVAVTEYCDACQLSVDDRLRLFVQTCEAVHHSHQKGIIHRDIKPSNVLVRTQGEKSPIVKVIDFGVAKATVPTLVAPSVCTSIGRLVGTLEYMSPEQVDGGADLDTRTDIYSLGILLYELVVGELPFNSDSFRKAPLRESLRRIREDAIAKPSVRMSTLGEAAEEAAKDRQHTPASLARRLRGDLDWIVLKALDKDRTRRYSVASEFVGDIHRHLRHEPILAGPPGLLYCSRKFFLRNRVPLALAAAAIVVVLVYIESLRTLVTNEREARHREKEAKSEALFQKDEALARGEEADRAKRELQAKYEEIVRLADTKRVRDYIEEADEFWPPFPPKIPSMKQWLAKAEELVDRLPLHVETLRKLSLELSSQNQNVESRDRSSESGELPTLPWYAEVLEGLVRDLERFAGNDQWLSTVANVKWRIRLAEEMAERASDEDYRWAWRRAIEAIEDEEESPRYQGLKIQARYDLVPLGKSPQSGLWEFVHLLSGQVPHRDEENRIVPSRDMGIVFVLIPGDRFLMGAQGKDRSQPNYDPDARPEEGPVHEVVLDSYYLSKYEMTQDQWKALTGENPSDYIREVIFGKRYSTLHPVENIGWEVASEVLSHFGMDLATEAQWEYAARGGTGTPWSTGSKRETLRGFGNIADSRLVRFGFSDQGCDVWMELDDSYAVHAPVGSYKANPFGLYDVHGNVAEWCRDHRVTYEKRTRLGDGLRESEDGRYRVHRGGSWYHDHKEVRSSFRNAAAPNYIGGFLGIRPSIALE